MHGNLKILYIASRLPKRSETFVSSEILGLRKQGVQILCASVHPPEKSLGDPDLEALAEEAIPIYGMGLAKNIVLFFKEVFTRPLKCLGTVRSVLSGAVSEPVDAAQNAHKLFFQSVAAIALARRMRTKNVSHVHAHMAHVPATIAWITATHLQIPYSFTGHGADLFRDRSLLKAKLKSAAFTSCISFWHRAFYHTILPKCGRHYPIVRCGVDTQRFARCGNTQNGKMILSVGRLVKKKGFDLLLKSFCALHERHPGLHLVIGGSGPEYEQLLALAKKLGIPSAVTFLGDLTHAEVRALMTQATLFVLPCRIDENGDRDGIPVVLLEAMASGIPCVSTDLPPIRELLIDGSTGALVPQNDVHAMTRVMAQLLENSEIRSEYARNARAHIESEFSSTKNIQRLITAFEGRCAD